LIDTYDDLLGAENAIVIAKELEAKGYKLGGVRLDSGDLAELSIEVRRLLDDEGLKYVRIFASGDLD
jgi:nicotinate phosphoribosyltransferase